jgi:hypothetical protein
MRVLFALVIKCLTRLWSSGLQHRVVLQVVTIVSEERVAIILIST